MLITLHQYRNLHAYQTTPTFVDSNPGNLTMFPTKPFPPLNDQVIGTQVSTGHTIPVCTCLCLTKVSRVLVR